jgi:hypothetical protein
MYELVLLAPESAVEELSQQLIDELVALSVSVEDADADDACAQAIYGEPGAARPNRVAAVIIVACFRARTGPLPPGLRAGAG